MAVDVNNYAVIVENFPELYTTKYNSFNKDEKYNGATKKHYEYLNMKMVLTLVNIIKYEHEVLKTDYLTLIVKYDLIKLRDKLICCNIDFDKLLKLSNLPSIIDYVNNDDIGIETIDVEHTFEISPIEVINGLNYDKLSFNDLLKEVCNVNKLCCKVLAGKPAKTKYVLGFVTTECKPLNL